MANLAAIQNDAATAWSTDTDYVDATREQFSFTMPATVANGPFITADGVTLEAGRTYNLIYAANRTAADSLAAIADDAATVAEVLLMNYIGLVTAAASGSDLRDLLIDTDSTALGTNINGKLLAWPAGETIATLQAKYEFIEIGLSDVKQTGTAFGRFHPIARFHSSMLSGSPTLDGNIVISPLAQHLVTTSEANITDAGITLFVNNNDGVWACKIWGVKKQLVTIDPTVWDVTNFKDYAVGEVNTGRLDPSGNPIFRFTFDGTAIANGAGDFVTALTGVVTIWNHSIVIKSVSTPSNQFAIPSNVSGSIAYWYVNPSGTLIINSSFNPAGGGTLHGFVEYTKA